MGRKLAIIGGGGHGKVVKEVAESMLDEDGNDLYASIIFLDDKAPEAVGKIAEMADYCEEYDMFVGIGNNKFRKELLKNLEALNSHIPVLIHPTAYISPSAKIEKGTIVEPKALVNANSLIKRGSIISVGAIVDHDVLVNECCHVNAGAICKAGSNIEDCRKLEAGEVVNGY